MALEIAEFTQETQNLKLSDFEYRGPMAKKYAEETKVANSQSHLVAPGSSESDQNGGNK